MIDADHVVSTILGIAALFGALTVIWHTPFFQRPVKWVVRRLFAEPTQEWFKETVSDIVDQEISQQIAPLAIRQAEIEHKVDIIVERVEQK